MCAPAMRPRGASRRRAAPRWRPARATGLLAGALLAALGLPAWALSTDRDQPIEIEADRAEADDSRRVTVYQGNVILDQGTLRITGDTVTIYFDESGELTKLVSIGRPARFRQLPDGESEYRRARAQRMEYYAKQDLIVLLGKAAYGQGKDRITAERIVYDSRRSRIKADSAARAPAGAGKQAGKPDGGRVRIKIMPRKKSR